MPLKYKDLHLETVTQRVKEALMLAIMQYHTQPKGVKVTEISITPTELNPDGVSYAIRATVQITLDTKEDPK